jgi:UDP-N-acetylglucosamine--N-acetylmuramyl-(pentapeptide) pyrophosphoryl-undecaprenol N-acetylglucosamine transferase
VAVTVTGNPVRPSFEQLHGRKLSEPRGAGSFGADAGDSRRDKRLVVIAGAGGARSLNESMPAALARLGDRMRHWQVVHQSGEGQLQNTVRRYRDAAVDALVVAYIDEMASILFDADLVVCRATGTTLAELALAGVPAILVPYPPAVEYQLANAEVFAAKGAATIVDETELARPLEVELAERLDPLVCDAALRRKMAAKMRCLARPDAAENVTDAIHRILRGASARLAA